MGFHARFLATLLQIALFFTWVTHAVPYAQPLNCIPGTGTNCDTIDPSIIKGDDGIYYRYKTNGGIFIDRSSGTGASALQGPWTYVKPVFQGLQNTYGVANLWAPHVVRLGPSNYIIYYSVSTIGSRNSTINYGLSSDLINWVNYGPTGIVTQEVAPASAYNAIDPTLILVNNQYYMVFGSYWSQIQVVAMENPPYKPINYPAGVQQIEANLNDNPVNGTEAAFVYQYTPPGTTTPYLYLFFSDGYANGYPVATAGTEYKIKVCRSLTVTGPYVDSLNRPCTNGGGDLVLETHDTTYAPGSNGVIDDPCGPVLYYQYANTSAAFVPRNPGNGYSQVNFQLGINYLQWQSNGFPIVGANGSVSSNQLGYCLSASSSSSSSRPTSASTAPSSATTRPTSPGAITTTTTVNANAPASSSSPGPVSPASTAATNLFSAPSAGVCSVTSIIVVTTSTLYYTAGQSVPTAPTQSTSPPGSYGCTPISSTVFI